MLLLKSDISEEDEEIGYLEIVFENGNLLNSTYLGEVRHNLAIELKQFSG